MIVINLINFCPCAIEFKHHHRGRRQSFLAFSQYPSMTSRLVQTGVSKHGWKLQTIVSDYDAVSGAVAALHPPHAESRPGG